MSVILDIHYYHDLPGIPLLIRMVVGIQNLTLPDMAHRTLKRKPARALQPIVLLFAALEIRVDDLFKV